MEVWYCWRTWDLDGNLGLDAILEFIRDNLGVLGVLPSVSMDCLLLWELDSLSNWISYTRFPEVAKSWSS